MEEFSEYLYRKKSAIGRQLFDHFYSQLLFGRAAQSLGISQDIGIEREPHLWSRASLLQFISFPSANVYGRLVAQVFQQGVANARRCSAVCPGLDGSDARDRSSVAGHHAALPFADVSEERGESPVGVSG
jgi:hypothetical protein